MAKVRMYAYAHMEETRNIRIYSIGDFHTSINEKSVPTAGMVSALDSVFKNMKTPAPFIFIWVPDQYVKAKFTTGLKPGYKPFYLDLTIQILDDNDARSSSHKIRFHECTLRRNQTRNGRVKVEASYGGYTPMN